jgi:hypothetical protein
MDRIIDFMVQLHVQILLALKFDTKNIGRKGRVSPEIEIQLFKDFGDQNNNDDATATFSKHYPLLSM